MKILIIRHGDPDYANDSLTEKGRKEAELLSRRLLKENIDHVYCSTLGRARRTIEPYLIKSEKTAAYCEWLREFDYSKIALPYLEHKKLPWDLQPEFVNNNPDLYLPDKWREVECIKDSTVAQSYDQVCRELDNALAKHGYIREKNNYRVEKPNHDTIVLTCHFGVTCVLMSHLLNCSPYSLWQHTFTAPTSVTTLYSEERWEGTALFRASGIGDVSHLYAADEPISFQGRFCECFTDDTRHH